MSSLMICLRWSAGFTRPVGSAPSSSGGCAVAVVEDHTCLTTTLFIGQDMYTPNLDRPPFSYAGWMYERPYAAWLYAGGEGRRVSRRALRTYSRGRFRNTETVTETGCLAAGTQVMLNPKCIGSIECICWTGRLTTTEWQRNYDSARAFALDPSGQRIPAGMEDKSELIAQPIVGGRAHANIHLFKSGDPEHTTLKQWLSGSTLATCTPPYN